MKSLLLLYLLTITINLTKPTTNPTNSTSAPQITQFAQTLKISFTSSSTLNISVHYFNKNSKEFIWKYEKDDQQQTWDTLEQRLVEICFERNYTSKPPKLKWLAKFCNDNFYAQLTHLDMPSNELRTYPNTLVLESWFEKLVELSLANNSLTRIEGRTHFERQLSKTSLVVLDLSHNRIEILSENTFSYLIKLREVNLRGNQIKDVNFWFYLGVPTLERLDLSENQIDESSMEFLLFSSLNNLRMLNMSNNRLNTTVSNHLFYNLHNLMYLYLDHNDMHIFDLFGLDSDMLKVLDLSFNYELRFERKGEAVGASDNNNNNMKKVLQSQSLLRKSKRNKYKL